MTVTQAEQAEPAVIEEEAGRLEWIDPLADFNPPDDPNEKDTNAVIIDPYNHRKKRDTGDSTQPDPGLIASAEAIGIQTPPILRPQVGDHEGQLGVVAGQRRMKAARIAAERAVAANRPYRKVRVIIRDDLKGADDEVLVASMAENVHRRAASPEDDLETAQQLTLLVGAKRVPKARKAQLAAAIGRTPEELDVAAKVAKLSPEALDELWECDVELDWVEQADYDAVRDVPNALMKLEQAKRKDQAEGNTKRGAWRQAMQALRAEQAKAERIAKMRAELAEKMIPVVNWPYRWEYTSARPLDELVSAIGRPLTEAGHNETCEGHAAAFDPADGEVVWVCTDYKKHGHRLAGAPDPDDTHSPEADEKAAAEREAAREEARRVKTNNAAWRTAREVRQAFIVDMCQDKGEAPADVKDLVLTAILTGRYTYTHYVTADSGSLLAMFLKSEKLRHTPADEVAKLVKRTGAKRYWWLLFAHVAGMYEFEHMTDEAWRGKKDEFGRRKPIEPQTVEWLNFLRKHGYSLSEVEEETLATAQQQADEEAKRVAERAERDARWRRERAEADDTKQEAEDSQPDEDGEPGDQTDAGPAEDEPEDTADEPEDGTRADDGEQSAAEDE